MARVRLFFSNPSVQFVLGLICIAFAIFLTSSFLSFFSAGGSDQSVVESVASGGVASNTSGKGGAIVTDYFINKCFGWASILALPLLVLLSFYLMKLRSVRLKRWTVITVFLVIWCSVLFDFLFANSFADSFMSPGGRCGEVMTDFLYDMFGIVGLVLFLVVSLLLFMIYLSRNTITWLQKVLSFESKSDEKITEEAAEEDEEDEDDEDVADEDDEEEDVADEPNCNDDDNDDDDDEEDEIEIDIDAAEEDDDDDEVFVVVDDAPAVEDDDLALAKQFDAVSGSAASSEQVCGETVQAGDGGLSMEVEAADGDNDMGGDMLRPINPKDELSYYKPPTLDLLDEYEQGVHSIDKDEQAENANNIVKALKNFGIEISSIKATVGPTITLYEITPAPGVRISKIRNLEDDIAMSLSALCIRIVAPIPGKGTIGIEVPNAHKQIVPMVSLLNSRKYKETDMALPLALGKTISNEVYMVDMAKMPHLLVAGATGMGKSVGLNAIITSLLYKKHPAELKLVMVDPKMVEFSIYSPIIKHFLAKLPDEEEAIITDTSKVIQTLKSLCIEMDDRYKLLKDAGVRSVKEYNEMFKERRLLPTAGHRYMPYIVVIIDEYGDLIMTAGKEVEMPIARIAQKARAVGMHMIIATQRPTTNIVTGTIKANFPARMSFKTTSMIDSKTILDRTGANQLIGRGDLLFMQGSECTRVQCAFVDTPEVTNICNYIKNQQGYTDAYMLPEVIEEGDINTSAESNLDASKLDSLFEEAARLIVIHQQGSTSLIQRKFAIGYNRAGRLMDQLERAGVVGKADGSKPRQVLCADEMDLDRILENYR